MIASSCTKDNITIQYYPKSKIIEIDKEMMILETMPTISFYTSSQTGAIEKLTSYTRSTFIKTNTNKP